MFSNIDFDVILFYIRVVTLYGDCHDEITWPAKNDSLYLGNPSITFECGINI